MKADEIHGLLCNDAPAGMAALRSELARRVPDLFPIIDRALKDKPSFYSRTNQERADAVELVRAYASNHNVRFEDAFDYVAKDKGWSRTAKYKQWIMDADNGKAGPTMRSILRDRKERRKRRT